MLQNQTLTLPFVGGLDTKSDPKQVIAGEMLTLENVIWQTVKKFRKRNGYTGNSQNTNVAISPTSFSNLTGSISNGVVTASYNNELVMNDGQNLYSWSPANSKWNYRGRCELASLSSKNVYSDQNNNIAQDSAYNSTLGITVYAWEAWSSDPYKNSGFYTETTRLGVKVSIVDSTTGASILVGSSLASTTSRPKVLSIGSNVYVIYYDSADSSIHYQAVTASGLGSSAVLVSDNDTTNICFDFVVVGSTAYFGYNASGGNIKLRSYNSSLVQQATVTKAETASNGLGLFSDSLNNIWTSYNNGSSTKTFVMNSALSVTQLAPTVVDSSGSAASVKNVTGVHDGTRGIIFYDKQSVPMVGQQASSGSTLFATAASFTQPAVGSTVDVTMNVTTLIFTEVGQIVQIPTGGYYFVKEQVLATGHLTLVNLGFPGNASPGATVASSNQNIYTTSGFQNALITYNTLTLGGTAGTPATFTRALSIASKAFLQNGFAHLVCQHDSPAQAMYFVCSLFNVLSPVNPCHVVAKIGEVNQGGGYQLRPLLPNVNSLSSNNYQFALLYKTFSIANTSNNTQHLFFFNGLISSSINFAPTQLPVNTIGNNLHIGGGCVKMYDGASSVEHGFHLYPETITAASNGGVGQLSAGTYGYCVVYEWIDNQGQTHRSAPSPVVSVVNLVRDSNTVVIPTLRVTEKQNVTIELYRTAVNGTIYYRIDTLFDSYPINNSVSVDTISVTDSVKDADITGNRQLYTTGEVADHAAPNAVHMTSYKNRLVLIPADNQYSWWYSKQVVPGYPVEFSLSFINSVSQAEGPLTALAPMDDKLILFRQNSISYVVGSGPAASGVNNDFTDPFPIPGDVGCVDPSSVVSMEDGVMFKSNKGIYLLTRNLQTVYIGAAVETYNSNHVLSAQLVPGSNQIRFCLDNGKAAVFDYLVKKWGTFTNHSAVSSCIWNGVFTYLQSNGLVLKETPGTFTDNGTAISLKVGTSWLQFAGVQGFQRVREMLLLGDYVGTHNLQVQVYKNFDAATLIQTTTVPGALVDGVYQWRIPMTQQKCESMMFVIQDVQSGSYNEGMSLSAVSFNVGVKKGPFKLGATHTYG